MDKEYALMCDCPEIHGTWEQKEGDKVYWKVIKKVGHVISISPDDGNYHVAGHGFPQNSWLYDYDDDAIFMPCIEDIIAWLGNRIEHMTMHNGRWVVATDNGMGSMADTLTDALLRAYMNIEHGKVWDGKQWVLRGDTT